jgi:AcrR family transcriptional regulator
LATARDTTAVPTSGRKRKLRRGPLTRKQILDASLRLFSEKGFARTSVRDIAQAAGITDAAIYYHFESKRELFEALIEERGFTSAVEGLERTDLQQVTVGPAEAIRGIAESALALMYANRDLMKVLLVEAMAGDAVAMEEYRMLVERWERAEARILRHYAARHAIRTDDVDELAKQLVVTVIGAFADFLASPLAGAANGNVPASLMCSVQAAMDRISQGITAGD